MKGIQKEGLSDYFKFIRVTEGGRTQMRRLLLWGFLSNFKLHSIFTSLSLSLCPLVYLFPSAYLRLPGCLSLCQAGCQFAALFIPPFVFESVAMPPTPQPTDDVDIYFETPADDKEHSRFQRAKEQLEIRHRNRMERVSHQVEWGQHFPNKETKGQFLLPKCIKNVSDF